MPVVDEVVKRKPGRPKKVVVPVKRGPGRPPKVVPKRKPGRPSTKDKPRLGRPPKKSKKKSVKNKKGINPKITQFNLLQYALKKYLRDKGLTKKVGKDFNKVASKIWEERPENIKNFNVSYWDRNIGGYYSKVLGGTDIILPPVDTTDIKNLDVVPYWKVTEEIGTLSEEVNIIFQFEDDLDWNFEGTPKEFEDWYKNGEDDDKNGTSLYKHIIERYKYASFTPTESGKDFVNYTFKDLEVGEPMTEAQKVMKISIP